MYKLYYTEAALDLIDERAMLSLLDENRRARIFTRPPKDRISASAASCLLRYALYDTGNEAFADAPINWDGKPCFADPIIPLYFNLSHTVDKKRGVFAAAVLLSETDEVGVDIEFVHEIRNREVLMRRLFTSDERGYIDRLGTPESFFDIWCAKEAFVKWTGEGFSCPLSSVAVDMKTKCAVSGAAACDLEWYTVGECRICCAAENLSSGMEIQILTPEQLLSM